MTKNHTVLTGENDFAGNGNTFFHRLALCIVEQCYDKDMYTLLRMVHGASFKDFSDHYRPIIDIALTEALDTLRTTCPDILVDAMSYSLLSPGKRLRPLLVLLGAHATKIDPLQAMPAAVAIEMVHAYSLIHDDLPAMDDDDLRRGRPTNHKVYGEGNAILAGDALLTQAFTMLSKLPDILAARCTRILSDAAGPLGMVGGQADDLLGIRGDRTIERLESIHHRKTGALIVAALQMGAVIGGASDGLLHSLAEYGERLGLLFQIRDDLLDVEGDSTTLGKATQKDVVHGKCTYPSMLGMDGAKERMTSLMNEAYSYIQNIPQSPLFKDCLSYAATRIL